MAILNRSQLADLRGTLRMTIDATDTITGVVENMHRTVQMRSGPLGAAATGRPRGIAGLVYRCVRGGVQFVGQALDSGLEGVIPVLPDGESSPKLDAYRSAVNGVYGDYLLQTRNPLAIEMSLHYDGQRVDPRNPAGVFTQQPAVSHARKLVLLVHGLCMNDRQWHRDGHDHGAALADEHGYLPLYLRYNSGLSITSNGRLLAALLETLLANQAAPPDELVIIGHSMGGLVARGACHQAHLAGHVWPKFLRKLVFLGTPHHGAPLERGGHGLDRLMEMSPYSMPFTRLSKARSAGITDLRHGAVAQGRSAVPLPAGVQCYAAAAVRASPRSRLRNRLIGDGLVPLDSALGRHADKTRELGIPRDHQWIGYEMRHLDLLSHPEVYRQLSAWLQAPE